MTRIPFNKSNMHALRFSAVVASGPPPRGVVAELAAAGRSRLCQAFDEALSGSDS
jgi:hypothetical protein